MRLGGPIFDKNLNPESWAAAVRAEGYSAAYCPVDEHADDATVAAYARAAAQAGLIIAEVGAWSNPLSPDEATRTAAIRLNQERLALADRIGARCCVNIAGSLGKRWDGPAPENLSPATFDLIVETVRGIIDAVKPTRTYYTLETMPWVFPDSCDSYVELMQAIDRKQFAVHLDPCNLLCSPQRFFRNGELIRDCIARLGPYIRSCHAKDIALSDRMTTHLDEVRPGLGGVDYATYLRELDRLAPDVPLMLEHLPNAEEYRLAHQYVRSVARQAGVTIR